MKFLPTILISLLPVPWMSVASAQKSYLETRLSSFHAAIDAEWQCRLKTHPEMATYVGDARYNDRLTDFSPEAIKSTSTSPVNTLVATRAFSIPASHGASWRQKSWPDNGDMRVSIKLRQQQSQFSDSYSFPPRASQKRFVDLAM